MLSIPVSIKPGSTSATSTPLVAYSTLSASVNPLTDAWSPNRRRGGTPWVAVVDDVENIRLPGDEIWQCAVGAGQYRLKVHVDNTHGGLDGTSRTTRNR